MTTDVKDLSATVQKNNQKFLLCIEEIGKVIVGQKNLLDSMLIGLLANGHLLLEGLPGLAKTLAVNTFAQVIQCDFKRIQFTPDLLPADLIGTSIYNPKDGTFSIKKGPLFTNIVLADEINRAPPKVQAALLEVMQEHQITIGSETFKSPPPFLVLATQNPIEQEGTYPLPEAQTDRFMMKVLIEYPSKKEEKKILERMASLEKPPKAQPIISPEEILASRSIIDSIYVDEKVSNYILDIIFATRSPKEYGLDFTPLIDYGASPRATLALSLATKAQAFLAGRGFVTPHDVKTLAPPILRHRMRLSYEGEAEGVTTDDIINQILDKLPVP